MTDTNATTQSQRPLGIPYARAFEDGSGDVECPVCLIRIAGLDESQRTDEDAITKGAGQMYGEHYEREHDRGTCPHCGREDMSLTRCESDDCPSRTSEPVICNCGAVESESEHAEWCRTLETRTLTTAADPARALADFVLVGGVEIGMDAVKGADDDQAQNFGLGIDDWSVDGKVATVTLDNGKRYRVEVVVTEEVAQ